MTPLTEERVRELLADFEHCVRYSERNPQDGYAKDEVMVARRVVIDAVSTRPSGVVNQWVPLSDRSPPAFTRVLVSYKYYGNTGLTDIKEWDGKEFIWPSKFYEATHWRPLPDPPAALTHPAQPECPDCGNTIAIIDDGKNKECACGVWPNNDASAPSARGDAK